MPAGPVYVHLDLDVLDPAISPGVNFQAPGGLTVSELEHALREVFGRADVSAIAVTNYNPHRDAESRTLHIVCGLIRFVCALADQRGLRNAGHSR
jgi:arginase